MTKFKNLFESDNPDTQDIWDKINKVTDTWKDKTWKTEGTKNGVVFYFDDVMDAEKARSELESKVKDKRMTVKWDQFDDYEDEDEVEGYVTIIVK